MTDAFNKSTYLAQVRRLRNLAAVALKEYPVRVEKIRRFASTLRAGDNIYYECIGMTTTRRQGLIHADLHFGNILLVGENLGTIDFDDCGHGFHAYDLVIPILSVEGILGEKKCDRIPEYRDALFSGYSSKRKWDKADAAIYPHLTTARKLLMLGWLNSRSDNPRLRKHMPAALERALKYLKQQKI